MSGSSAVCWGGMAGLRSHALASAWRCELGRPRRRPPPAKGGYVLEHDAEVAKTEPGTHNGGGRDRGLLVLREDTQSEARVPQAGAQARLGHRLPRAEGRRDLLRPQRPRRDDDRRQELRGHARDRGAHPARQLPWSEAGRAGRPRHHDQLRADAAVAPRRRGRRGGVRPAPARQVRDDAEEALVDHQLRAMVHLVLLRR